MTIYQSVPYLRVAHDYPTAKRTIKEVKNYSSGPAALLAASSENRVWGGVTSGARDHVHSKNESVFFPGGLILVLALIGRLGGRGRHAARRRRLRIGLGVGMLVVSILALGLGLTGAGYPYRLLYDYAPGWNGVRVPGRIFTLATLFYALLAGAGVQVLTAPPRAVVAERHAVASLPAVARRGARDRHRRRRRRPPRPPGRAAAREGGGRAARDRCSTCRPTAPPTASGSTSRRTASTRSRSATAPSTSPPSTTCAAA